MPSPKRWLQPASDGGQNGGAGNGAAESLGERSVLEEVIPGAEEHLEEALVAESPNVGMNPNVDMVSNTEAEGRAVSVSPKPGEKRNWDATGGIDREMEVTVLRVLHKHGYQPSTSTSGRMVDQESQTDLIGEVLQAARRPLNKIKRDPSSSSQGGGSGHEQKGADSFEAAPAAEYAMGEEEILQMEAERLRQLSEEEDEMRQVSERDGFRKDEHLIKACDGTTWEWHLHEDGRQYYYCLDTQESKWTLPVVGEKMKSDEVVGSPSGNELEMEAALDSSSSTPKTESTRAFQGSVNSLGEKDFSSTIRDSGPRAGGDALTSGSPDEEEIPGNRADIAGAQHLDPEGMGALSEGVAAVESVGPEEKIPNVEIGTVSAAEERVVDVVPVVQECGPGDSEDGGKRSCVATEEVSSFGAKVPAIQGEKEASGIAGDTEDLKNEAWSANDARVDAPDITWSAKEARVEVHMVLRSTGDCNNGAQVSAAADGGSQVDALVQPEVSREERNSKGYTGANEAAVVNDGGNSPLEAMEPKEPAVEESVPAVDDRLNRPAVEEDLPAAEGVTKDSNDGSTPMKGEVLPSGSSPEVDTERITADEAKPLAEKKGGPEVQEHKKDELVGLVEQDEQCDPKVKTKDAPGADDTEVVSEEHAKKVPRAGALESPGTHCYQEGDEIMGLVRCINGYGAFLDLGDLNVLIPAEGNNTCQFRFGDTVNGTVKLVEDDGTIILDTFLVLEEDVEDSSSTLETQRLEYVVDGFMVMETQRLEYVVDGFMVCWSMVPRFQRSMGLETGGRAIR